MSFGIGEAMRENTVISLHKFFWAAYVLALVAGSLVPVDMSAAPEQSDKVLHFLAYGLMVFFWPASWKCSRVSSFWLASGLGLLLEIAQGVLPTGRFMDFWDVTANAVGAGVGATAALLWSRFTRRAA
jgi:VanZ family protein